MTDARATKNFWALDLSKKIEGKDFGWQELAAWPGQARIQAVAVAQSDGVTDCFYLFSGRNIQPGRVTEILTDAYSYNPHTNKWKLLADVAPKAEAARCVMAGAGIASGANHILVFGGDAGSTFLEREQLGRQIERAKQSADSVRVETLTKKLYQMLENQPGFSNDILAYHTITDTWVKLGKFPSDSPVATVAVDWDGSFIIPGGDIRPSVCTPRIWKAEAPAERAFGWVNYSILGAYLLVLVAMGFYFSRRETSTNDFFKAGGRIPWWAVGLSVFGTQLSAGTFMASPAKAFATDWQYLILGISIAMVSPFIIFVVLPFYRRLNVTTAYEYLEKRFNVSTRLIGSLMFIAFQLGRISIVLFLPSIALSVVTGIDVRICILLMGGLSITYTVLGGIEAVIWTDVLQVVVLLGGALLCVIILIFNIEGGVFGFIDVANAHHKFRTFNFTFDLTTPTFWVVLLGALSASFISYGTDQAVIQRYLTTKDESSAAQGIWANAALVIPASLLFITIGTALFVFYKSQPQLMNPTLKNTDAIFPWYIVTQLPQGVAGLLIAGVFAATMSSLDSSMNSVATAVTTDFYRRFRPEAEDHTCLNLARWITVITGVAGTGLVLMMVDWNIKSLWDQYIEIIGLFAGGLGGLFLLGIFSRRAHGVGAVVGLVGSGVVQFAVKQFTSIHVLLYAFTGLASCIIIGYIASLVIAVREKPISGLTIYTIGQMR
jgi:SSS family transporter